MDDVGFNYAKIKQKFCGFLENFNDFSNTQKYVYDLGLCVG